MMLLAPMLALVLAAGDDVLPPPPRVAPPQNSVDPAPPVDWPLPLGEAVRIGLVNAPVVQVVAPTGGVETWNAASLDQPIGYKGLTGRDVPRPVAGPNALGLTITPKATDPAIEPFRAALLAHVRSVEQQYWALVLAQANLATREQAVRVVAETLQREKAETELIGGRGGLAADIAEAEERLETIKLNLGTATADVVSVERGLRNLLGLPASDNRRIIATTPALDAKFTPDWEPTLAQMFANQPEVCAARAKLAAVAVREVLILDRTPATEAQRATLRQERERHQDQLAVAVHQANATLARFFLGVTTGFEQFQRERAAEAKKTKRLQAQQAFFAEGRITVDRLIDAITQQADATARATQARLEYNTAIAALAEASGTLLDQYGVTVVLPTPAGSTATAHQMPQVDAAVEQTSATSPR